MHLSGDYMNRKFKKEIGYTLVEYIHYYRCNMAKKLLCNDDLNVTEISGMVGYNSPAYFTKVFKKQYGMTPVEFKKFEE